jgi:hypothetical protein
MITSVPGVEESVRIPVFGAETLRQRGRRRRQPVHQVTIAAKQGCQMVYFHTKNPNLGKFLRAL